MYLAHGERWPLPCLIVVAFLGCATLATVDVALEALVVETVGTSERALTATAKQAGATVGSIIGLSLLIVLYAHLGWHAALLILAALNAAATLPMLCYHEARRRRVEAMEERSIGSVGHRLISRHALVLAFYFAAAFALAGPNHLALLDLGVALPTVAFLFGTVGPVTNIAATLLVGPFVMRLGTPRLITLLTGGMIVTGILMLCAFASASTWPAFLALGLGFVRSRTPAATTSYWNQQRTRGEDDAPGNSGTGDLVAKPHDHCVTVMGRGRIGVDWRITVSVILAMLVAACGGSATEADPYLWLEEWDSPRVQAWIAAENARTLGVLEQDPRFADNLARADMQIPVLDMVRYEQIAAGASWVGEYGTAQNPDERAFLESISPYAQLKPGVRFPEAFIWTTTKDDRVGPQHARKFAARLSEFGVPYLFYEAGQGGRGGGTNVDERAHTMALEYTYLQRQLM